MLFIIMRVPCFSFNNNIRKDLKVKSVKQVESESSQIYLSRLKVHYNASAVNLLANSKQIQKQRQKLLDLPYKC